MDSAVTSRKRTRGAPAPGAADSPTVAESRADAAAAHLSFASSHGGPLSMSSLSASGVATAGRVCTIASHARLEQVNKQLELLRRLDADAHEVVVGELREQVEQLRSQVEALTRALEVADRSAKSSLLTAAQPPPAPAGPSAAASQAAARAASDQLAEAREDAAAVRRLLAHEKEAAAARDAAAARTAAQYAAAVADLQVWWVAREGTAAGRGGAWRRLGEWPSAPLATSTTTGCRRGGAAARLRFGLCFLRRHSSVRSSSSPWLRQLEQGWVSPRPPSFQPALPHALRPPSPSPASVPAEACTRSAAVREQLHAVRAGVPGLLRLEVQPQARALPFSVERRPIRPLLWPKKRVTMRRCPHPVVLSPRCLGAWTSIGPDIIRDTRAALEAWAAANGRQMPDLRPTDVVIQNRCAADVWMHHPASGLPVRADSLPAQRLRVPRCGACCGLI